MEGVGLNVTMDNENEGKTSPPPSRARHNSKQKFLTRSHAMREAASPPREPSSNQLISPSIQVSPSTESAGAVTTTDLLVESLLPVIEGSLSPASSPCRTPRMNSPTSTITLTPSARCSPRSHSPQLNEDDRGDDEVLTSSKCLNRHHVNSTEKELRRDASSHLLNNKKKCCDCSNHNCIKCAKNQERNYNNNLMNLNSNHVQHSNTLSVHRVNSKGRLKQQSASQGSFEGSASNSPNLTRDNSTEQYSDTSGIDLELFIRETLNRNAKDRAFLLRIEQELVNLAKDSDRTHIKFPPMSSYQRMLVHRVAAYCGMDHNVDSSGKCVVVNKTKNTRIPDVPFKEHVKEDIVFSEEPRRSILKRDSSSIEDYSFKSPDRQFGMENMRSKSYEEREVAYAQKMGYLRQMRDDVSHEAIEWNGMPWSSTDSDNSSKCKLQLPEHNRRPTGKLVKVLSEETGETLRPYVAKSFSFGGYCAVLNRGDSMVSSHSAGPRLLTKQDSGASSVSWRLSPSSSGYKSQSIMSESVTPSPTSTPHPVGVESMRQDMVGDQDKDPGDSRLVWAVTDMQSVPKGSIIIDPQTGESIKNEDGSLYHYDPNNLPPGFVISAKPPPSPKKTSPQRKERSESPKKRSLKHSPSHNNNKSSSHVTNSSTSPILPYSPPLPPTQQQHLNRGFQFFSGPTDLSQQYPIYGPGFGSAPETGMPVYQQPCIVYGTFGIPVSSHYDGRIEQPPVASEMSSYYMNVQDSNAPPAPAITYQQQAASGYWNQPPVFYQNAPPPPPSNPTPPQRYSMPIHPQTQPNYVSSYPQNYIQTHSQAAPPPSDLMPVYPHQSLQMVYPAQNNPTNPVMYPNQPIYPQNPVYSGHVYQQNVPSYPQNTSTPNSCTSSVSHTNFPNHMPEQSHQNLMQLTQNMAQMSFVQNQTGMASNHQGFANKMMDLRAKTCTPKGNSGNNKFNNAKSFILGSSQSSTGTNSPAATVVANYGPQHPGMYRTPSDTPPSHFAYGPPFSVPPMLYRQMSNVRASTPGTARSSRSPTPANDMSHLERSRIPIPPNLFHGLPYVLQSDNRLIAGRGQPNAYRHPPPVKQQSFNQGSDNRSHKNRKTKGNKMPGLPPNGKPL